MDVRFPSITSSNNCTPSWDTPNEIPTCYSADVLDFLLLPASRSQIRAQRPVEQLLQHLEAYPRDRRIIASLAQLVADERICPAPRSAPSPSHRLSHGLQKAQRFEAEILTLRPSNLIPRKRDPLLVQRLSNQIPAFRRDMIILLPEDHNQLPFNISRPGQAVVVLALAEAVRVDVRREIADGSCDARVEGTAVGEVAAEAHTCCADAAVACLQT